MNRCVDDNTRDEITELVLDGLSIDGGHHKQYYLEKVLLILHGIDWLEKEREEGDWEKGIAP